MSKLSSRVMNMKFMQSSSEDATVKKDDDIKKKVRDESEWVHPNASRIANKIKIKTGLDQVGYGTINELEFEDFGSKEGKAQLPRRTWNGVQRKKDAYLNTTKLKDGTQDTNDESSAKASDKKTTGKKRKGDKLEMSKDTKQKKK